MGNLKHGFYSSDISINPDSLLIGAAALRSKHLATLVALFDDPRLNVGHLYTSANINGESIKGYFWGLCLDVEKSFDLESPQAKYANLAALLISAIVELKIDSGEKISNMAIRVSENWKYTQVELHLDSIVSKMAKLRARF